MACLPVWDVLLAVLGRLHVLPRDSEIYKMNLHAEKRGKNLVENK